MKITDISGEHIFFDNGNKITYSHEQDCCEHNYADFEQLEEFAMEFEFDENLEFEFLNGSGFRFGNGNNMFFVPCYSSQNGYYSTDISVLYNGECVLNGYCMEDFYD